MRNDAASAPSSVYVSVSPSGSVAATASPTCWPDGMFSSTSRIVLPPSSNVGGAFELSPVLPVPDADQSLGVSPFSAITCTEYSVSSSSEAIVAIVPVPGGVVSAHEPLPVTSYRSL